jgi:hypothetical protein
MEQRGRFVCPVMQTEGLLDKAQRRRWVPLAMLRHFGQLNQRGLPDRGIPSGLGQQPPCLLSCAEVATALGKGRNPQVR